MRTVFALPITALLLAGAGLVPSVAEAGPAAPLPEQRTSMVTDVAMYRRYQRSPAPLRADRYYDGAVVGEAVPAPLVVIRPSSCGQYKYWNGVDCVDARYTNPYLGLKG